MPQEQIQAIVNLLSPENPNQSDALFLVQKAVENLKDQIKTKDKQIALLEEKLVVQSGTTHRLINEKLALQAGVPRETTEHNGVEEEAHEVTQQEVPKGKTL